MCAHTHKNPLQQTIETDRRLCAIETVVVIVFCRLCRIGFVIVKFFVLAQDNRGRPKELYACTGLAHRLRYIWKKNRCSLLRYTFCQSILLLHRCYCYCYACILLVSINRLQIWSFDDIAPHSHALYTPCGYAYAFMFYYKMRWAQCHYVFLSCVFVQVCDLIRWCIDFMGLAKQQQQNVLLLFHISSQWRIKQLKQGY